jgi:hypothetical protein
VSREAGMGRQILPAWAGFALIASEASIPIIANLWAVDVRVRDDWPPTIITYDCTPVEQPQPLSAPETFLLRTNELPRHHHRSANFIKYIVILSDICGLEMERSHADAPQCLQANMYAEGQ